MLLGWFKHVALDKKKRAVTKGRDDYATHSDFCAVFLKQLDRLYSLALILTADELRAEECFLEAFDSCEQHDRVFKESAVPWSRRSVIKAAIRRMSPAPFGPNRHQLLFHRSGPNSDRHASIKCVLELPDFDRFVFVMSVLAGYSNCDCALLLGHLSDNVAAARIRAFKQMSRRDIGRCPAYGSGAHSCVVDTDWLECG